MAKILVTGSTGFIGKRLITALLQTGHEVYALVRIKGTHVFLEDQKNLKLLWGDLRDPEVLQELPQDIDAAYYLMHSMADISKGLLDIERQVAENFVNAMQKTHVKQIIYLGGIIDEKHLSLHLKSRLMVEDILKASGIPTTILRSSIIIGEGSASFEIIRDLVEKLPIMIAPRWIHSLCQPIAVRDVIYYLQNILFNAKCFGQTFDIGGPDILSFKEILLGFAEVRKLKRYIFSVPVLTPKLSSYWLCFVTSVRFSLASYLVETMKSNTYCRNHMIHQVLPHTCLSYEKAIESAFTSIAQNEVLSTWMDSWDITSDSPDIQKYIQVPHEGVLFDRQVVPIENGASATLERVWSLGGNNGWYAYEWAWNLRGLIDKLFGGVGMNRGRRHPSELVVGDSIDFWRVLKADKINRHLILFAEMKVPGEAWLEFKIEEVGNNDKKKYQLVQTATFRPRGVIGRLYWYSLWPIHLFIFRNMAKAIANGK